VRSMQERESRCLGEGTLLHLTLLRCCLGQHVASARFPRTQHQVDCIGREWRGFGLPSDILPLAWLTWKCLLSEPVSASPRRPGVVFAYSRAAVPSRGRSQAWRESGGEQFDLGRVLKLRPSSIGANHRQRIEGPASAQRILISHRLSASSLCLTDFLPDYFRELRGRASINRAPLSSMSSFISAVSFPPVAARFTLLIKKVALAIMHMRRS